MAVSHGLSLMLSHPVWTVGFLQTVRGIPRTPNVAVRRRCHIKETLTQIIRKRQLTWLGHVLRMKASRIPQQTLLDKQPSEWRRPRGHPRQTWDSETRSLTDHIRHSAGTIADWSVDGRLWLSYLGDLASSRTQWRQIVDNLSLSS